MAGTKHLVFQEIINRGKYDEYLNFAAYMHITQGMSYFNSALVFLQRPGAVCVKTEYAWLRDYERTLRPGMTPIVIMKIGGPVSRYWTRRRRTARWWIRMAAGVRQTARCM